MADTHDITRLLEELDEGDDRAMDRLMDRVYEDLSRMAAAQIRRRYGEKAGTITLEPAALVNESFLRLVRQRNAYTNRGQFFSVATRVMLRVLIDYQRQSSASKRGGSETRIAITLEGLAADGGDDGQGVDVAELAAALDRLETMDPRKAEVARMRIVWDMTPPEIARLLGISLSTVEREWRFARAWIAFEVGWPSQPEGS